MSTGLPRKRHHSRVESFHKRFASLVKTVRKDKGIPQTALAEKVGLQSTTISNIETGHSWPDLHTIALLCDELEIKELEF